MKLFTWFAIVLGLFGLLLLCGAMSEFYGLTISTTPVVEDAEDMTLENYVAGTWKVTTPGGDTWFWTFWDDGVLGEGQTANDSAGADADFYFLWGTGESESGLPLLTLSNGTSQEILSVKVNGMDNMDMIRVQEGDQISMAMGRRVVPSEVDYDRPKLEDIMN